MHEVPLASTTLRLMTAATFAVQVGLLAAAPIPSPVSTRRMWRRRSGTRPDRSDPPATRLPPLAALAGMLLVLAAVVYSDLITFVVPAGIRVPTGLHTAAVLSLLAGNLLVAAAALTLKRRTVFDAGGQSTDLITDGVFGLVRHPIVLGMGLIYLGFFLALPSPWVCVGLVGYGLHQHRRLSAEEALLEARFGTRYRAYRRRVGPLGPRWSVRRRR